MIYIKWFHQTHKYTEQTTDTCLVLKGLQLSVLHFQRIWNFPGSRWACPLKPAACRSRCGSRKESRRGKERLWRENLSLPFRACTPGWSHRPEIYNSTSTLSRPCLRATQLWTRICKRLQRVPLCAFSSCVHAHMHKWKKDPCHGIPTKWVT